MDFLGSGGRKVVSIQIKKQKVLLMTERVHSSLSQENPPEPLQTIEVALPVAERLKLVKNGRPHLDKHSEYLFSKREVASPFPEQNYSSYEVTIESPTPPAYYPVVSADPNRSFHGLLIPSSKKEIPLPGSEIWEVKAVEGTTIILKNGRKVITERLREWLLGDKVLQLSDSTDAVPSLQPGDEVIFKYGIGGGSGSDEFRRINDLYLKTYNGDMPSFRKLANEAKTNSHAVDYLQKLAENDHPEAVPGLFAAHRHNPDAAFALVVLARKNKTGHWAVLKNIRVEAFVGKAREEWNRFVVSLGRDQATLSWVPLEDTDRFNLIEETKPSEISGLDALKAAALAGNAKAYSALAEEGLTNFHALSLLKSMAEKRDGRALNKLGWMAERNREALEGLLQLAKEDLAAADLLKDLDLKNLRDAAKNDTKILALLIRLSAHRPELPSKLALFPAYRLAEAAEKEPEALRVLFDGFSKGGSWYGKVLKEVEALLLAQEMTRDPLAGLLLLYELNAAGNPKAFHILKSLDPQRLGQGVEDSPPAKSKVERTETIPDEHYEVFSVGYRERMEGVLFPLKNPSDIGSGGEIWTVKAIEGDLVILHQGQEYTRQGETKTLKGERRFQVISGTRKAYELGIGQQVVFISRIG